MANPNVSETTIEEYVGALSRRLRWTLPRRKAAEITSEVEAHLHDRIDELTAAGTEPDAALRIALAGFGPVGAFSRAVTAGAYEDSLSPFGRWGAATLGVLLLVFVTCLLNYWFKTPNWLQQEWRQGGISRGGALFLAYCAALCAFAFVAKRPQTGLLAKCAAVALIITFLNGGFNYISGSMNPIPRADVPKYLSEAARLPLIERDVQILEAGCKAYIGGGPITAELKTPEGGFIVPIQGYTLPPGQVTYTEDALREPLNSEQHKRLAQEGEADYAARSLILLDHQPYRTVATAEEAQAIWREVGEKWRDARRLTWENERLRQRTLAQEYAHPARRFYPQAALNMTLNVALAALFILLLDGVSALLGRLAFRIFRGWGRSAAA